MADAEVYQRYIEDGYKEFKNSWMYKIYSGIDIIHIIHLCRRIGWGSVGHYNKCTACGANIPFALIIYGTRYA